MAFPSDVPVAAVATINAAGDLPTRFALTQTVEIVPLAQVTILSGPATIGNGHEQFIAEVKKRFDRATPGSGAWAEVAL